MLNLYWNSRVLEALALDELALGYRWLLSNGMPSDMVGERYAFIITGPGIAAKLGLEVDFAIALSEPKQDEDGVYHAMRMPAVTAPLLAGMVGLGWQIAEVFSNGAYRPRLSGELKIGSITGYNPPPETPVFSDSGILIIEDDESDEAVPTRRLRTIGVGRRGVASYVARFLAGRIAEPTEAAEFALLQRPAVDAAQEGREQIDGAITDLGVATALEFAKVDDKLDVVDGKIGVVNAAVAQAGTATDDAAAAATAANTAAAAATAAAQNTLQPISSTNLARQQAITAANNAATATTAANDAAAAALATKQQVEADAAAAISAANAAAATRVAGPLPNGVWVRIPSIYRLRLTGTGSVAIDARDSLGAVTMGVASYTLAAATNRIEYPYLGDTAVEVRATLTGSATAEML